jgi:hypothetical protein
VQPKARDVRAGGHPGQNLRNALRFISPRADGIGEKIPKPDDAARGRNREHIHRAAPGGPWLPENLGHLVAIGSRRHLDDLRQADHRSLEFNRIDQVFALARGTHENDRAVAVAALDFSEESAVRIAILADGL